MVLALVRKHHLEQRVLLQSFDFRTLHAMAKIAPEIKRVALWEGDDRSFVTVAKDADAPIVSPQYQLVTPEKVRKRTPPEFKLCRGRAMRRRTGRI